MYQRNSFTQTMSTISPLNKEKSTMPEDLNIDEMVDTEGSSKHSWWRILLILVGMISSMVTFVFIDLATSGSNGIFTQRTANVSDQNPTDFTPASWIFVLWFIIFVWQEVWLVVALIGIPRKSHAVYSYTQVDMLHYSIFIFFIFNMALHIGWLLLWDRGYFGWSSLIIFLMFLTIVIPTIITHNLVQRNRPSHNNPKGIRDIWLAGIYINNVFIAHGTWLYLLTLLNWTIWVSQIYNRNTQSITDVSSAAFSLLLVTIVIYFVCENLLFFPSMDYICSPWFILIFVLSGIVSKHSRRANNPDRNEFFTLALLITCCVLLCIRIVLYVVHYKRRNTDLIRES